MHGKPPLDLGNITLTYSKIKNWVPPYKNVGYGPVGMVPGDPDTTIQIFFRKFEKSKQIQSFLKSFKKSKQL